MQLYRQKEAGSGPKLYLLDMSQKLHRIHHPDVSCSLQYMKATPSTHAVRHTMDDRSDYVGFKPQAHIGFQTTKASSL